jgi:hypothetical protein
MELITQAPPPTFGGFSDKAVQLFEGMLAAWSECTCSEPPPGVDAYWAKQCQACEGANWLEERLHDELGLEPWQFPVVCKPCEDTPEEHRYPEEERRYHDLFSAVIEAKKTRLRDFLERHPHKRRGDGYVYQQTGPARFRPVPRREGMTVATGWLSTADLMT